MFFFFCFGGGEREEESEMKGGGLRYFLFGNREGGEGFRGRELGWVHTRLGGYHGKGIRQVLCLMGHSVWDISTLGGPGPVCLLCAHSAMYLSDMPLAILAQGRLSVSLNIRTHRLLCLYTCPLAEMSTKLGIFQMFHALSFWDEDVGVDDLAFTQALASERDWKIDRQRYIHML